MIVKAFGISAGDFGTNVKERTKRYWTEDPNVSPEDLAEEKQEGYQSADFALNGTRVRG
jgi:hypothetical protein